jgi:cell division protein ZapA
MNQIEVQIMGQSYLLGCPEGGEPRLREAVGRVDEAMCRIRDAGKVKARDRIAVLAALNLAFDSHAVAAQPAVVPATAAAPATEPTAIEPRIAQLRQRIDQVLGDDGRLL